MSLIQRRLSRAGLARQTAGKGTAATAATYAYGVDGGSIFKIELTENEIPLTWSNRDILGYDRQATKPVQDIGTVATPNLTGLLLLGILGADAVTAPAASTTLSSAAAAGATQISTAASIPAGTPVMVGTGGTAEQHVTSAVSGAGPYTVTLTTGLANAQASGATVAPNGYTHTITPAASLPYLTAFGSFGTADWAQIVDCKVSSLELSWTEAGRLTAKEMIAGCTPSLLGSAYTEANLEVLSQVGYFGAGGGTFNIEGVPFSVSGGNIKFDSHIVQPVVAASTGPADVVEGKQETTWSLTILPTDTGLFREVYYATKAAGALAGVSPFPHLGSIAASFPSPAGSLAISSPQVRFAVEFPESHPDGGPAELTLTGTSVLPASGATVTATVVNQVASY